MLSQNYLFFAQCLYSMANRMMHMFTFQFHFSTVFRSHVLEIQFRFHHFDTLNHVLFHFYDHSITRKVRRKKMEIIKERKTMNWPMHNTNLTEERIQKQWAKWKFKNHTESEGMNVKEGCATKLFYGLLRTFSFLNFIRMSKNTHKYCPNAIVQISALLKQSICCANEFRYIFGNSFLLTSSLNSFPNEIPTKQSFPFVTDVKFNQMSQMRKTRAAFEIE